MCEIHNKTSSNLVIEISIISFDSLLPDRIIQFFLIRNNVSLVSTRSKKFLFLEKYISFIFMNDLHEWYRYFNTSLVLYLTYVNIYLLYTFERNERGIYFPFPKALVARI